MEEQKSDIGLEIPNHLFKLIQESFPHKASGEAFVVSVYGEWGSGKTWCLKALEKKFSLCSQMPRTIQPSSEDEDAPNQAIYLPVLFSPWRFEKEEHLVIPLLKTIQRAVIAHTQQLQESELLPKEKLTSLKAQLSKIGRRLGGFATAMAAGLKFQMALPGIAKITLSGKDAVQEAQKQDERVAGAEAPDTTLLDEIETLESLYYNAYTSLEEMTNILSSDYQLRLVVLIDDLDRCLPENAVQMLESIKLFLNIKNFAFVLAVDDEVVERGINHKYKDYHLKEEPHTNQLQPPISGSEYLEKIVHLPLHLPRWSKQQVETFLVENYPNLFLLQTDSETSKNKKSATEPEEQVADRQAPKVSPNSHLLELVLNAIPPVPRKLIRLAEAMQFKLEQLSPIDRANFMRSHDANHAHLARVTLLQQLYPEIYRLLRNKTSIYDWLFEASFDDDTSKRHVQKETPGQDMATEKLLWSQLSQLLIKAKGNRYGKCPLEIFHQSDLHQGLKGREAKSWFNQLYIHQEQTRSYQKETGLDASSLNKKTEASISVPHKEAIESLTSLDISYRQGFIADHQLLDKSIPQRLVDDLIKALKEEGGEDKELLQALLKDNLTWLEDMAAITNPEQLLKLYKELDILPNIQNLEGRNNG